MASPLQHAISHNTPANDVLTDEEATAIFVGKNYDYFKRNWDNCDRKGTKNSWNNAAFFLNFYWLLYRKMYGYFLLYLGFYVLIGCFFKSIYFTCISIGIVVQWGLQGNYLYKTHIDKKVTKIVALNAPQQARIELARQGGTSIAAVIGGGVLVILSLLLVIYVNS